MAKKVFFSFHYKPDCWRVSQIKQIGSVEGQPLLDGNKWEEVKKKGEQAIKDWIANNMNSKDCLVVLIGANTAGRKWVKHEITEAWNTNKGVLGIHIHNLKNSLGDKTTKGANPFASFKLKNETPLSTYAKTYDPPHTDSTKVYDHIKENIEGWVAEAIRLRKSA